MIETVRGPVRGYYVAAYACPVGKHGREFVGYYKVFGEQPSGFFADDLCLLKGAQEGAVSDAGAALERAVDDGIRNVRNLPPAGELPACREHREMYVWEMWQLGLIN